MAHAPRTIAMGDIHGCIHALDSILSAIQPQRYDTLVCLGDFIDQGRDSRDVIDRLIALESECRLITILGNHEQMLLEATKNERALDSWFQAGGFATLNSYVFGAGIEIIPDDHLAFIRGCRDLGHLVCIDTACWRHGWLTAIDVDSGETWQASRFGVMRSEFAEA